jgi:hypothetical protein
MGIKNKKHKRDIVKVYRGVRLCQNYKGPCSTDYEVMALDITPEIEVYFKSLGAARKYIDRFYNEIKEDYRLAEIEAANNPDLPF